MEGKIKLCECGCNKPVKLGQSFIKGHWLKGKVKDQTNFMKDKDLKQIIDTYIENRRRLKNRYENQLKTQINILKLKIKTKEKLKTEDEINEFLYWETKLGSAETGILKYNNALFKEIYSICEKCKKKVITKITDKDEYLRSKSTNLALMVICDECRKKYEEYISGLKTMPYKEYLKTEHWENIRKEKLKRSKYSCQLCNSKGILNVHHKIYSHRGLEQYYMNDLIVLCKPCHEIHHEKFKG